MTRFFISFVRIFKSGFFNFLRNLWLSMAATAIMVVTLTIVLGTIIINRALDDTIDELAQEITVSVYLHDQATEQDREVLKNTIEEDSNVKAVIYVSKEAAQARYIERNKEDAALLDAIEVVGNTFPASFEIELYDLSQSQGLVEVFEREDFANTIEEFDKLRLESAGSIGSAQRFITRSGAIAAIIFAVISMLVIFNTIRIAIFARSSEIQIMQLIGATNNYIRGPFLVEAAMYGIASGLVALAVITPLLNRVAPVLENNKIIFEPTLTFFNENLLVITLITISSGILIGVASSLLAMSKYLRLRSTN